MIWLWVLPLASYACIPLMLPLLKTFLELLMWSSFQCYCHIFFGYLLQYPEIFFSLRETLFLETVRSLLKPIQGKGWVFHFSLPPRQREPCELGHCHGGESNCWVKVWVFSLHKLHITASVFAHTMQTLWNEFKVNNSLDFKECDKYCLHYLLCSHNSLWTMYATQKHLIFFMASPITCIPC